MIGMEDSLLSSVSATWSESEKILAGSVREGIDLFFWRVEMLEIQVSGY